MLTVYGGLIPAINTLGSTYTVFQTIKQMHDYLDRSGEVFEYDNTASPDSHGWRGQPVPIPVLRVVMDWPFALYENEQAK